MKNKTTRNRFCVNCKNYAPVPAAAEAGQGTCSANFKYDLVTGAPASVLASEARFDMNLCGQLADDYKAK